jgi:hypothetical protein
LEVKLETEKARVSALEIKVRPNEEMREHYNFYRTYFLRQQGLYNGYFAKWDADYEERVEAAGGIPELPKDMPAREDYDEEPEIREAKRISLVNIHGLGIADDGDN